MNTKLYIATFLTLCR